MILKRHWLTATATVIALNISLSGIASAQTQQVDLDQFVELVKQHSKELQLAVKDREEADAQKNEARSLAYPHLAASAGYTRNLSDIYMYVDLSALSEDGGSGGAQKLAINRNNEFSAGVSLTQTLFSGSVFNAIKAAKQYRTLTDYTYDATFQYVMTVARQAYSQALLLEKVVEVAAASEKNAEDNYHDTNNRYESGLASEFELLQAESRYREAVPATAEAKRNLELAMIGLKNLAGLPADEPLTLLGTLNSYPEMPNPIGLDAVLGNRPDYNARLWEEKLRRTNVSAQRAAYFPSLAAVAAYGYSAQSDAFRLEEENNSWTVGLKLSVPIFNGGETRAKVHQASVQLDRSRIELAQMRDDIEKELRSVRLRLEEAHERIKSAETSKQTAEKAFSIAEQTTRVGLTTQLELKDTRVMLDQATVNYYAAIFDYVLAYHDWKRVVGETD